ncbi:MAG: hypothetical protein Q7R30_23895 [Acidobacteriota bacterium]|nr:hypothetical protein [Acidobacteriota bacterium]
MSHGRYSDHKHSFHEANRLAEVLCAIARHQARSTKLPCGGDISRAVGFDANTTLVHLVRKKLVESHGTVRNSWFNLTAAGELAVVWHCRRAA